MNKLYKVIPFNIRHGSCGGSLVQFQQGDAEINALPFSIGKVLVMSDIRTDDVRGNHAHYETEEILVALTGGCVVDLDDGRGTRESVRLSACGSAGVHGCGSKGVEAGNTDTPKRPYSDTKEALEPSHPPPVTRHSEEIKALLLFPHIWRTMRDFEPGTTLMVVANIKYDEADYIRDRAEFEQVAAGWRNLGGSAAQSAGELGK